MLKKPPPNPDERRRLTRLLAEHAVLEAGTKGSFGCCTCDLCIRAEVRLGFAIDAHGVRL